MERHAGDKKASRKCGKAQEKKQSSPVAWSGGGAGLGLAEGRLGSADEGAPTEVRSSEAGLERLGMKPLTMEPGRLHMTQI